MRRLLLSIMLVATAAAAQPQADVPNGLLLVAKPGLTDANFRETVVLVTQTVDSSTVGVILNRPTPRKHDPTGEPIAFGGPVMPEVLVALFAAERAPQAAAFHVLKDVYLTMHPQNLDALRGKRFRLFAGFAGWAPGQLQSELARDGWFVLPARMELLFRRDTRGMWDELVRKARGRVAMR